MVASYSAEHSVCETFFKKKAARSGIGRFGELKEKKPKLAHN
jgi:hypothetical protein